MQISFLGLELKKVGVEYHLLHEGSPITTPLGTPVKSTKKALINAIKLELECEEEANLELLGYYSLFCTQADFIDTSKFQPTKENFREYIFNDPVLSASAGPEVIHQYTRWEALFDYLELSGLSYPNFPQSYSYEDKERWIQDITSVDPGYSDKINSFVNILYQSYLSLDNSQRTVFVNSTQVYNSPIYGLLLALGNCDEVEYASALMSSNCLLPEVFGHVEKSEYKEGFYGIQQDALIMTNFIKYSRFPSQSLTKYISSTLPNWAFLHPKSQIGLSTAIENIIYPSSKDYSPYVMLLGKSLEINLKEKIFLPFQEYAKVSFEEEQLSEIIIRSEDKLKKLTQFLDKPPHFIELGSMLFILEMYGGKTAKKNVLLSELYDFMKGRELNTLLEKNWIENAKILKDARNKASHSEVFSHAEAERLLDLLTSLLKSV